MAFISPLTTVLPPEVRLTELAKPRKGAFHISHAWDAGFAAATFYRRVRSGFYRSEGYDVFTIIGHERTFEQRCWIALLSVPTAALSHRTTAWIDRLDGFDERTELLELTVPASCRWVGQDAKTHRSADLEDVDITLWKGARRTTTTRLLVDLGQVEPPDVVYRATMSALRRNLSSRTRLSSAVARLAAPGRVGPTTMRDVLDRIGTSPPTDSDLESRGCLFMERMGWPPAIRQHRVVRPDGRDADLDFAWVPEMFAVELHGRVHDPHHVKRRDNRRDALLRRLGWHIVYLCWEDIVDDTAATMAFLREEGRLRGIV